MKHEFLITVPPWKQIGYAIVGILFIFASGAVHDLITALGDKLGF